MAQNYDDYLGTRVLNDSRPVTYRLLSRALKVNVNTAKQMLYEYHSSQNAKKPKSVHATYLLTGRKPHTAHTDRVNGQKGEDTVMASSPPPKSSMPEPVQPSKEPVRKISIVLVREEELEKIKAQFLEITSIHVYSLEPGPIESLRVLWTCKREIVKDPREDTLQRWRTYGSIRNTSIEWRGANFAHTQLPLAPKAATESTPKPSATTQPKAKEATRTSRRGSASEDNTSGRSTPQPTVPASKTSKKLDSKASLKRDTSNIFKSFAKAKPPKPKEAEKSKESTPAPTEDDEMQGMSEDEDDDPPEVQVDEEKIAAARRAREVREANLRKMMEDEDDDMPDAPLTEENDSQGAPLDKAASEEPTEKEVTVTVQGGRRRGRRRIMVKKKVKNEDGYLVTKEEAAWESFSEAEPEPKKSKPAPAKPGSTAKGKKTGKPGHGSIASFFTKA